MDAAGEVTDSVKTVMDSVKTDQEEEVKTNQDLSIDKLKKD